MSPKHKRSTDQVQALLGRHQIHHKSKGKQKTHHRGDIWCSVLPAEAPTWELRVQCPGVTLTLPQAGHNAHLLFHTIVTLNDSKNSF